MSDGTPLCIAPFMLQGYTSTLRSLTPMDLGLMHNLWMDSSSVSRGWCQVQITG